MISNNDKFFEDDQPQGGETGEETHNTEESGSDEISTEQTEKSADEDSPKGIEETEEVTSTQSTPAPKSKPPTTAPPRVPSQPKPKIKRDPKARLLEEGSGIVLRDLFSAVLELCLSANVETENIGDHVLSISKSLKSVAQSLKEMFINIKVYASVFPSVGANIMLATSRVVQEKVKGVIVLLKQFKQSPQDEARSAFRKSLQDLITALYQFFNACEAYTLPANSEVIRSIQKCAQNTTQVLHIAFGTEEGDLPAVTSETIVQCERLYHFMYALAPTVVNSKDREALITSAVLIENKAEELKQLAEKYVEEASTDTEESLKEAATVIVDKFRQVTLLFKTNQQNPTLGDQPLSKEQLDGPMQELDGAANGYSMLDNPLGKNFGSQLKLLIDHLKHLMELDMSNVADAQASLPKITNAIWKINKEAYSLQQKCSDADISEQITLFLRTMRYYSNLLHVALAGEAVQLDTTTSTATQNALSRSTAVQGLIFSLTFLTNNLVIVLSVT
eukprot:TRINITY_DN2640_c0_g1_i3.p1 TRINITY_DN2640_c0_g1~~TRINITY_DN2640_c0_g1_i3.p1  ORF type:complete len:505 (+),score=95.85 TRINITY_DN2640_c0_g1_i3:189-1703(+)